MQQCEVIFRIGLVPCRDRIAFSFLAIREFFAGIDKILSLNFPTIDAEFLRRVCDGGFDNEHSLWPAKAAKSSVWRKVCPAGICCSRNVRNEIRIRAMKECAFEDRRREIG